MSQEYDANIYATPNIGLAAFLITCGHKVTEATKRDSRFGGQSYFFVFGEHSVEKNGEVEEKTPLATATGRELAGDFRDKKALVEPFAYYEAIKELRALIRDTRASETSQE